MLQLAKHLRPKTSAGLCWKLGWWTWSHVVNIQHSFVASLHMVLNITVNNPNLSVRCVSQPGFYRRSGTFIYVLEYDFHLQTLNKMHWLCLLEIHHVRWSSRGFEIWRGCWELISGSGRVLKKKKDISNTFRRISTSKLLCLRDTYTHTSFCCC